MGRRENTFRIDYADMPKKPDIAKVHKFCATVLGLKKGEVLRIQNSRALGVSFVKVVDLALAQRVCEEHDNKHEISADGKKYPLRITLEDGAVEVSLSDLSEDVSNQTIAYFLGRYGDVISIREELCGAEVDFPGIPTGVRIVRMVVKRNIESWVTIDSEATQVSYFGQRQTCRHCREYIHVGASCVQNRKLLVQKSYADAAKQPNPTPTASPKPKQVATIAKAITNRTTPGANPTNTNSVSMLPPKQIPQRKQQKLLIPAVITDERFPSLANSPASVQPSASGSLTPFTGQQPPASGGVDYKTASGTSDGNETDTSVGSSSSKRSLRNRPPGKKARVENIDDDMMQDGSNQPS